MGLRGHRQSSQCSKIRTQFVFDLTPRMATRLTHLLREAQSHWPPFCFHSKLCKNDTRAAYQKTRMPWNWDEYFKCLWKLGNFQQAQTFDRIRTITFKNGSHCVRALRCHQGIEWQGHYKPQYEYFIINMWCWSVHFYSSIINPCPAMPGYIRG